MAKQLFVGPFPTVVTKQEKEEFLLHFGAVSVTHISLKKKQVYVIAGFSTQTDCAYALKRVHQVEIFGARISAKYYDPSRQRRSSLLSAEINYSRKCPSEEVAPDPSARLRDALLKYEAQLSAISSNFGVSNPICPKLRYCYPPPTPLVLCNIAHALVAVPKFYTQVLHLMNKMNLPCPFGPLTGEPPLCQEAKTMTGVFKVQSEKSATVDSQKDDLEMFVEPEIPHHSSDSESELESDEDAKSISNKSKQSPPKRLLKPKPKRVNKRPKLEALKQSLIGTKDNTPKVLKDSSSIQEVFETPSVAVKKKLSVNVQSKTSLGMDTHAIKEAQNEKSVTEGFGKLYPQLKEASSDASLPSPLFVSLEELSNNQIEESDWPVVPVFKNYKPGTPSPRLYIKNLSKTVTENDLHFIFGRYLSSTTDEESPQFNIRLMKEGRMKGQAFVTFLSMETAALAIKEVNGYILKDKPMVIVFGRIKAND